MAGATTTSTTATEAEREQARAEVSRAFKAAMAAVRRLRGRSASSEVCLARAIERSKREAQMRAFAGVVTIVSCSRAWSLWPCET